MPFALERAMGEHVDTICCRLRSMESPVTSARDLVFEVMGHFHSHVANHVKMRRRDFDVIGELYCLSVMPVLRLVSVESRFTRSSHAQRTVLQDQDLSWSAALLVPCCLDISYHDTIHSNTLQRM